MQEALKKELILTRIYNAHREHVFKAWTDPKHLSRWWGPKDFINPICEIDPKPGGLLLIHMMGPDGTAYPTKGIIHEISAPERIVLTTTAFEDERGIPLLEVLNTVSFANLQGKTKLTLHAVVVKASAEVKMAIDGMNQGWSESLDRLGNHVEAK